jgi:uncharacterized pyridoxamine 5'-phosphate oxidase family protein
MLIKTKLTDLQKQTLRGIKQRLQDDNVYMITNDNNNIYMDITYNIRIKFECKWGIFDNINLYGEVVYNNGYSYEDKYILNLNRVVVGGFDNSYDESSYNEDCGNTVEEDEEIHYLYTKEGEDGFGDYLESIVYMCNIEGNDVFKQIIETIDTMLKGVE